jgi:hypothetical protein
VYTFRGYEEQLQIPLEPSKVEYIAILMAERQDGPFSMKIDWVHAVRNPHDRLRVKVQVGESLVTTSNKKGKREGL